jgi:hypothetical protein
MPSDQDRSCLLRLIDWMLLLPPERNRPLLLRFQHWREGNPVPFVSVFEQEILDQKQLVRDKEQLVRDREQQLRESCLRGIALGLKLKFKAEGEALFAEVEKQADLGWLRRFLDSIEAAGSCDDLRKLLP